MQAHEKIREYRELCGLTKKDVKTLGGFNGSEQYYGQCENGKYDLSPETIKSMYDAINIARAKKLKSRQQ